MTKEEALSLEQTLRLALEYVELVPDDRYNAEHIDQDALITAIKAALEAKDEPVVWNEGVPAMLPKQKEGETFIVSYEPKLEAKDEPAPVAKNEGGRITWMIDDWPQNCLLYTHPPKSFTYEQVKAHIRAASMSANDISVGSDTTEDGVSIVIRRRDELLYAEFFAYTPPQRKPLTDEEIGAILEDVNAYGTRLYTFARAIEAAHGIKGEA
jgi:hypothetical protein